LVQCPERRVWPTAPNSISDKGRKPGQTRGGVYVEKLREESKK
jgi:hypothetical protein